MFPVKPRRGVSRPRITVAYRKPGDWLAGFHTGTDFGWTRPRERVRATYKGLVVRVGKGDRYYGNYVVVWHPDAHRFSWYCHLSTVLVRPGMRIGTGRWLGYMGQSGNATGRHLHYEERVIANGYNDHRAPILFEKRRPPYALKLQGWR